MLDWLILKLARKIKAEKCGLEKRLISENRTRWLDLGSQSFHEGFHCLDIGSLDDSLAQFSGRYFNKNVLELTEEDFETLGTFDLIRMQHVLEHFSFEEAEIVLTACARLLKNDGYLLITVPDLRFHVKAFLNGYKTACSREYKNFAIRWRIPEDAPASCVFSVFAHQGGYRTPMLAGDEHKWCYDFEGVEYQVKGVDHFRDVRRLSLFNPLAGIPFTHNREAEDLCVIARKR